MKQDAVSFIRFSLKCCLAVCLSVLFIQPRPVCAEESRTDDDPINVVTYNIRLATKSDGADYWKRRIDAVIQFVSQWDVIGMQEVTPMQMKDLEDRLGDEFAIYGLGRDDGKRQGEHAAVAFRKDRFEALSSSTFWLCETPKRAGTMGWDAACPRTVSWLKLKDESNGKTFIIANTHFDHKGSKARENSAKLLSNRATNVDDSPIIVMGDFNCTPDSTPYKILTERTLSDARQSATTTLPGPNSTWNGFREIVPNRLIDHIFVSGGISVDEFQIHDPRTTEDRFASDHLPVRVSIQLD